LFDISKYGLIAPGLAVCFFCPRRRESPHFETTLYVARTETNPSQIAWLFREIANKRGNGSSIARR
jgi:hypothetical protein